MAVCPLCGWEPIYHGIRDGGLACPLVPKSGSPAHRVQLDAAAVEVGRRMSDREVVEDLISALWQACLLRDSFDG